MKTAAKKRFVACALAALGSMCTGSAWAGPVAVSAGPAAVAVAADFDAFPEAELPGALNIAGAVISAAFQGQTIGLSASGQEVVSGTPSGPLSLFDHAGPGNNVGVLNYGSQVVYGNKDSEIGEGVLSVLFAADQRVFGLDIVGQNGGSALFRFYARDGVLVDSLSVALADGVDETFAFTSTVDFAGITITHDDIAGLAYDNFRYVATPRDLPEPASGALLGAVLIGLALRRR